MVNAATTQLRSRIRELLKHSNEADPDNVAKLAFDEVQPEDMPDILFDLIRSFAKDINRSLRFHHEAEIEAAPAPLSATGTIADGRWGPLRRKYLKERHCIDERQSVWKFKAYLTADECSQLRQLYAEKAAANAAESNRFGRFEDELRSRGLEMIHQLPDEVIEEVMSL